MHSWRENKHKKTQLQHQRHKKITTIHLNMYITTCVTLETPATNKPYTPILSRPNTTLTTHLTTLFSAGVRCPCSLCFHAGQYTAPPSHTVVNTFWACQSRSQIPNQSRGSSVLHVQLLLIFQSHLSCSPAQTSKQ